MKKHASAYTLIEDIRDAIIFIIGTVFIIAKAFLAPLIIILIFVALVGGFPPDTLGE